MRDTFEAHASLEHCRLLELPQKEPGAGCGRENGKIDGLDGALGRIGAYLSGGEDVRVHQCYERCALHHVEEGNVAGGKSKVAANSELQTQSRRLAVQKALGGRIATWRIRKRISQEELADICGLHRSHMGQVERGESNVTMSTLLIIVKKLDSTLSRLYKDIA